MGKVRFGCKKRLWNVRSQVNAYGHYFLFWSIILFYLLPTNRVFAEDFGVLLTPVPIEASHSMERVRQGVFSGERLNQRLCLHLQTTPQGKVENQSEISKIVEQVIKSIDSKDSKLLSSLFHKRLKVTSSKASAALNTVHKIAGSKASTSLFRLMAVNSPDGSTSGIECPDTGVVTHPLYGFPLTLGVWLQTTGESEVVRVYFQLAPEGRNWAIGAWHVQQWTHEAKDYEGWYQLGVKDVQAKNNMSGYVALDIALKLMDGGGFLDFPVAQDIKTLKDKTFSPSAFEQAVKSLFPNDKIVYVGTVFVRGGSGIVMRMQAPAELSAHAIKDDCTKKVASLAAKEPSSSLLGIRCVYNFPSEPSNQDGVMGGMFVKRP
jgi:hypothetical protein